MVAAVLGVLESRIVTAPDDADQEGFIEAINSKLSELLTRNGLPSHARFAQDHIPGLVRDRIFGLGSVASSEYESFADTPMAESGAPAPCFCLSVSHARPAFFYWPRHNVLPSREQLIIDAAVPDHFSIPQTCSFVPVHDAAAQLVGFKPRNSGTPELSEALARGVQHGDAKFYMGSAQAN